MYTCGWKLRNGTWRRLSNVRLIITIATPPLREFMCWPEPRPIRVQRNGQKAGRVDVRGTRGDGEVVCMA